jgi:hypothetical protein
MSTPETTGSTPARAPLSAKDSYQVILTYLAEKGHTRAEAALRLDLASDANNVNGSAPGTPTSTTAAVNGGGKSVGLEDFAARNAPSAPRPGTPAATASQNGRKRPDQAVAGGQLLVDPPSWEKGYEGLRTFVENVSSVSFERGTRRARAEWFLDEVGIVAGYSST